MKAKYSIDYGKMLAMSASTYIFMHWSFNMTLWTFWVLSAVEVLENPNVHHRKWTNSQIWIPKWEWRIAKMTVKNLLSKQNLAHFLISLCIKPYITSILFFCFVVHGMPNNYWEFINTILMLNISILDNNLKKVWLFCVR